nr:unnamed protein product [Digitaria exilis]
MDIATGAMNTILPKLVDLVVGEYKLQKGVSKEIKELEKELESMNAALHHLAEMPADQLDELTKIWASDVDDCSGLDNNHLKDLGKLCLLRFLRLQGLTVTELPMSIGELESLETLDIRGTSLDFMAQQVPSSLQRFMSDGVFENEFPRWINSSLSCLTVLSIKLGASVLVLPEHLEKLAELPSLRFLRLLFNFCEKVQRLCLKFGVYQFFRNVNFGFNVNSEAFETINNFDYGLENLPSLRHVVCHRW